MTAKEVRSSVFRHDIEVSFSSRQAFTQYTFAIYTTIHQLQNANGLGPRNEGAEDRESVRRFRLCFKRSSANFGSIRDHMTFTTQSQGET